MQHIPYHVIHSNIKNVYIQIKDGKVIVKAPKQFAQSKIEEIVRKKQKWIEKNLEKGAKKASKKPLYTQEEFLQTIEQQAKELIAITGLKPNRMRVREIRYAWGSCSSNKNITINQKLIAYRKEVIRYVILHEFAHLKYMNHSKDFWSFVETYMPEYKEIRKELK